MKKIIYSFVFVLFAMSVFAQSRIVAPTLVSPIDDEVNQMPNVILDWNAVSGNGPVTYLFQLDVSDAFADPVVEEDLSGTAYHSVDLMFGTEYFWRVKAMDEGGDESDWSDVFSFTVFNVFPLHSPDDGDDEIEPTVTIRWEAEVEGLEDDMLLEGFPYFEYQVATDDAFNDIFIEGQAFLDDGNPYKEDISDLLFNTTFYWRVRAAHSNGHSDWTEVWSFSTIIGVDLDSPDDEADDVHPLTELEWDNYDGLNNFIYQYSITEDFSTGTIEGFVEDDEKVEINSLYFGDTYYWRVKGFHVNDTTPWSEVWSFTVLDGVDLDEPSNGSVVADLTPELKWDEVDGAISYEVIYATDNAFTNPISAVETDDSYVIPVDLEDNIEYFWKVIANTGYDETAINDPWSFTVNIEGINENLFSDKVRIYPNPCSDIINIRVDANEKVEMEIYNILGEKFFDELIQFENNSISVNIDNYTSGVYFVRIHNDKGFYTEKFTID